MHTARKCDCPAAVKNLLELDRSAFPVLRPEISLTTEVDGRKAGKGRNCSNSELKGRS